jgi:ribonuclease HI
MVRQHDQADELIIYTDGACSPNPGPGGWGAVLLAGDGRVISELSGYGGESTNNRMELTAAVEALKSLQGPRRIVLYTDSQYVKNGITDWIFSWQKNGWKTADRKPVKNSDLWHDLLEQLEKHKVTWKWVKGHGTDQWNNRADELAVLARKNGTGSESTRVKPEVGDDDIHLYTGVTCKHSSGAGGWSVILTWRGSTRVLGNGTQGLTANQLYLKAVIAGLEQLKKVLPVHVHTHSGYLYDGATGWLEGWQKRNWQTREGSPVSNREWWQSLVELLQRYEVHFHLADKAEPLCHMQEAKELAREFEQDNQ